MKTAGFVVLGILVMLCFGLPSAGAQEKDTSASQAQVFTGNEKHDIDLATAVKMIQKYRASVEDTVSAIKGGFFGRNAFEKILAQEGCVGIRYYYAQNDSGVPALVLVGVDAKGQDMQTGVLMEIGWPCPPFCSSTSELSR